MRNAPSLFLLDTTNNLLGYTKYENTVHICLRTWQHQIHATKNDVGLQATVLQVD